MMDIRAHTDIGTLLVILVTLALFIAAIFLKGLTHDLVLEAAVFMVSVKLIVMSYKHAVASREIREDLSAILDTLQVGADPRGQREASRPAERRQADG